MILRRFKTNFLLTFLILMLWSSSVLAWNIALPDQDKFAPDRDGEICVSYADGGIGFVERYGSCGSAQCQVLFPPSKEAYEEALSGKCKDTPSPFSYAVPKPKKCVRPWGLEVPVSQFNVFAEISYRANSFIRKIYDAEKRCPNSEEYEEIKKMVRLDRLALSEFLDRNDRNNREVYDRNAKELADRKIESKKFCKGMPKIYVDILEKVSIFGRLDPQTVRLNRVYEADDYCYAIFYTAKGVARAKVRFNQLGVIDRIESIEFAR